jgi:hypothetical protein
MELALDLRNNPGSVGPVGPVGCPGEIVGPTGGGVGPTGPTGPAGTSPLNNSWILVSAGASPFTPARNSAVFLAVDTSGAQVTIFTPASPVDGDILEVRDKTGQAAINPIKVAPNGSGVSIDDPSNPGTSVGVGAFAVVANQGASVWWKYFSSTKQWIELV